MNRIQHIAHQHLDDSFDNTCENIKRIELLTTHSLVSSSQTELIIRVRNQARSVRLYFSAIRSECSLNSLPDAYLRFGIYPVSSSSGM